MKGQSFTLDSDPTLKLKTAFKLPHPEILGASSRATQSALDDGRLRLETIFGSMARAL